MDHQTSKVKVYMTSDYKLFKFVNGNRGINKRKVDNIIKEIKSGNDVLDEVPVLVKETGRFLDILDGQHRFTVAQKLARPVHYILHKTDMNLYGVAKVNSNTEKWKAVDFVNCYKAAGNQHYAKLDAFHKKYGIGISVCVSMLTFGYQKSDGSNEDLMKSFEQGAFEVKKPKEATILAEMCKNFEAFPSWNSRGFIMAISKLLQAEKCEFSILIKKFNDDPKKLEQQGNWKGYLTNLENIYNVGYSKRRTIF